MKKILFPLLILTIQACSDNTVLPSITNTSNSNNLDSKLETNSSQSLAKENVNESIPNGIYFSYKKCVSKKNCQIFSPEKIDDKYYLSRNQGLEEDQYYLYVRSDKHYIYSLQFLDEDDRAVGSWSQMQKINSSDLSFEIESIEQVMGSDYMGSYDNTNINNKLNTLANQSGLLEIGSLLEGSKIPTHENIKFIHSNDGYKVDCENYIKKYEEVADELFEKNMAVGFHFNYECGSGNQIYFKKLS